MSKNAKRFNCRRRPQITAAERIEEGRKECREPRVMDLTADEIRRIADASGRFQRNVEKACVEQAKRAVQAAAGRPLNGFPMTAALCLFWGQIRSGLTDSEGELRDCRDIFRDVARFSRRRRAYREAMDRDGWLQREHRGNTSPSFFAQRTEEPRLAPVVWRMWWALAGRPGTASSSYNTDPSQIERALIQGQAIWRQGDGWRVAVRLIETVGLGKARAIMARPGRFGSIIEALRAWKWCPHLPKRVAVRVGRMVPWRRVAAKVAWDRMVQALGRQEQPELADQPRSEVEAHFWSEFQVVLAEGRNAALIEAGAFRAAAACQFRGADWSVVKPLADAILEATPCQGREWEDRIRQRQEAARFIVNGGLAVAAYCAARPEVEKRLSQHQRHDADQLTLRLVSVMRRQWKQWVQHIDRGDLSLHDWCHFLPLAASRGELGEYLLRHRRALTQRLAEDVCRSWNLAEPAERKLGPAKLVAAVKAAEEERQNPWMKVVRHKELLREAKRWGHQTRDVSEYREFEARWARAHQHAPIADTRLRWSHRKLVGRFLPRNDPRGLFLGQHTGCCQHPAAAGSACAWYGHNSPRSGFFVIEDPSGEVVAQSWAWIGANGALVLDSVEGYSSIGDGEGECVAQIYLKMAQDLAKKFGAVEAGAHIRVGSSQIRQLLPARPQEWKASPLPGDYDGYSDADQLRARLLLAWDHEPEGWETPMEQGYHVRGALSEDFAFCEEIARDVYPDGWQFVSCDEGATGLVLLDEEGRIGGYAVFQEHHREVIDLAMRVDWRTRRSAVKALFDAVLERVRSIGGTWRASARETTSLRMLRAAHRRRQIMLQELDVDATMGSDSMVNVEFSLV